MGGDVQRDVKNMKLSICTAILVCIGIICHCSHADTSASALFEIANVHNGDVLSGEEYVFVTVHPPKISDVRLIISLFVDQTNLGFSNNNTEFGGVQAARFPVETYRYQNGIHTIKAIDDEGHTDIRYVQFKNEIFLLNYDPVVDPISDKVSSQKSHISAHLIRNEPWIIKITDPYDKIVRIYRGKGNHIDITWDGTDEHNVQTLRGAYYFSISVPGRHKPINGIINKFS